MNDRGAVRLTGVGERAVPFANAEQAWFWAMEAISARRENASRVTGSVTPRPCTPDDVVMTLDRLYRQGRMDVLHAHTLHLWGERGAAPGTREAEDRRLWREALDRLEPVLRSKGIVA